MRTLGLFAKHPVPGQTKSRLAATIGNDLAAQFSECFTLDLIDRLPALADRFVVCVTPETEDCLRYFESKLPDTAELMFQPSGGLGERMAWFFESVIESDRDVAVLVGSDAVDLPSSTIASAFDALTEFDSVFGPSTDGGYTLVGFQKPQRALLEAVEYSTSLTMNQSREEASRRGISVGLVQPWRDVDEVEGLAVLNTQLEADRKARAECPRTWEQLCEAWPKIERVIRGQSS